MPSFDLLFLEDPEIAIVTSAVRRWCRQNAHDIDSSEGQQAMSLAVSMVQVAGMTEHRLVEQLSRMRM